MNHPLDGARLKIVRAQEHIDALNAELRMYLDEKPYKLRTEKNGDEWTFTPIPNDTPLRFGAIIGDCVANLRAALDYIAWQLAIRYFDPPLLRKEWGDISFPIFRDQSLKAFGDKIKCFANRRIPTDAINEIKAIQPHHSGYEPLWWLHELVNEDKHRMPLLTISAIPSANFFEVSRDADEWSMIAGGFPGAFKTEYPFMSDTMDVKCAATVFVAFQDVTMPRIPVDRTLEQIVKCITNIVPRFDRFF